MHIKRDYVFLFIIFGLLSYIIFSKFSQKDTSYKKRADKEYYKVFTFPKPKKLDFAGENVPLEDPEVLERFEREIYINAYWNSRTIILIKNAHKWFPMIEKYLEKYGIPEDFKYLVAIESEFKNVSSPRGASGFWQIMKDTGKQMGLKINDEVDERYNLEKATKVACEYLKKAYDKFGSWTYAAASYNRGVRGISRSIDTQKTNNYYDLYLNEETSRYIFRILAAKEIMTNGKKYGYNIPKEHLYKIPPLKRVKIDTSINSLAEYALKLGLNYKVLKLYNPWLRSSKLTVKNQNDPFEVIIPDK